MTARPWRPSPALREATRKLVQRAIDTFVAVDESPSRYLVALGELEAAMAALREQLTIDSSGRWAVKS